MPCSPPAQLNSRARGINGARAGSPPATIFMLRGAPRGMTLPLKISRLSSGHGFNRDLVAESREAVE